MKYKMIALDLDGTLKNSQNEITSKTKEALIKAQQDGIVVVLASGRPTEGIRHEAKELEIEKYGGYIISYNGAAIIDARTKETIYSQALTLEEAYEMFDRSRKYNIACMAYVDGCVMSQDDNEYVRYESWINDMGAMPVTNFKENLKEPVYKVLLTEKPELISKVEDEFKAPYQETLSISKSAPFFIEVMAKNIHKAHTLAYLAKRLNIHQDEIIAFGDGHNDMEMIEYAGMGVAMGNAVDVVKEVANYITASNDEDGIAKALNDILK